MNGTVPKAYASGSLAQSQTSWEVPAEYTSSQIVKVSYWSKRYVIRPNVIRWVRGGAPQMT